MRARRLLFVLVALALPAMARQRADGWCQQGGVTATIASVSLTVTQKIQQSFPGCSVTVYKAGTTNLATLFADNSGTALANPFTASATDGYWFFYASAGRYDVRFSGGGIGTPFTLGDTLLYDTAEEGVKLVTNAAYGAKCDGTTDDTVAIAAALAGGGIVKFPPGTCRVKPATDDTAGIVVPSNTTLIFHPLTIILALTGYHDDPGAQRLFDIRNVSNVVIYGNRATLQMLKAEYTTGEQRHGVFISQSTNVSIYDLIVKDTGGDGFLIAGAVGNGGNPSENITLVNCTADNARRNGLAITHCINCKVIGGEFKNTTGTSPQAGIDIEPNLTETIRNVELLGVRTSGNTSSGLKIVPNYMATNQGSIYSVYVRDFLSYQDGTTDNSAAGIFIALRSGDATTYKVNGNIVVDGATIIEPYTTGVAFQRWHSQMPNVILRNISVLNPNRTGAALYDPGNTGWTTPERTTATNSGFVVGTTTGEPATSLTGHIEFYNCIAQDAKAVATMQIGFYLHATGAAGIDALLYDPKAINYTLAASNSAVNWNKGQGNVVYSIRPILSPAVDTSIEPFIGYEFTPTAQIQLLFGNAANVKGATYYFRDNAVGYTLVPLAGDTIDIYPLTAGQTMTVAQSGRGLRALSLRADGGTKWRVVEWVPFYAANGPTYVVSGYGVAPNDPNSLTIGSQGTAPNSVSAVFGNGSGVKFNFGYHNGTTFVPTSTIYDTGRHDMASAKIGANGPNFTMATGSATWAPGLIAAAATVNTAVTVAGALSTSACVANYGGVPAANNISLAAYVATPGTATVTLFNNTGAGLTPTSATLTVTCLIQ